MKQLSKPQQEVLDLMKDGWDLCASGGYDPRTWLQKDGCGCGGPIKEVHGNTFYALSKRDLITIKKEGFPTTTWILVKEVPNAR